MRARLALLILGSAALGGCAYGYGGYGSPYGGLSVGVGYGSGYGGYGYGGYGGCYDPYSSAGGYGGYDRYGFPVGGYGYGSCGYGYGGYGGYGGYPYWGWNNGYYYPGSGYYVYDRDRRPYVWNETQKRYWTERVEKARTRAGTSDKPLRENWSGFRRQRAERTTTADRSAERQQRLERIRERSEARQAERSVTRATRSDERPSRGRDRKSDDTQPQ